jgi:ribosomal protein S18 acetylase RimI-like enzyme
MESERHRSPCTDYTIRKLRIWDIYAIHRMYDSLSEETKLFFHPGFLGFKYINVVWMKCQFRLVVSSIGLLRDGLFKKRPHFLMLPLVAMKGRNEIIGFAYLSLKQKLADNKFSAELGIGIKDSYQGMKLGSRLIDELLKLGRNERISKVTLTVMATNVKAINLYKKHGFRQIRVVQNGEIWRGKRYDYLEMELELA